MVGWVSPVQRDLGDDRKARIALDSIGRRSQSLDDRLTTVESGLATAQSDIAALEAAHVICTSSTRPSTGLFEGLRIYETDTDRTLVYSGSAWVILLQPVATYTPTLAGVAIGTGGSATNTANYGYAQGVLTIVGIIQFGTTAPTYPSTSHTITLPATFTPAPAVAPNYAPVGTCQMVAGGVAASGAVTLVSTTQVRCGVWNSSATYVSNNNLNSASNIPGTWTTGDYIRWTATIPGTLAP